MVKEMITNAVGSTVELEGETDGDTLEVSHRAPRIWENSFIVSLMQKENIHFCVKILYMRILKYPFMNELAITIHDFQRLSLMSLNRKTLSLRDLLSQDV